MLAIVFEKADSENITFAFYYLLLVLILVNNNSDLIFTVMLNFIFTIVQ